MGRTDTQYQRYDLGTVEKGKIIQVTLGHTANMHVVDSSNNSRSVWAKVPPQDFTSQGDIDWTKSISEINKRLYAKYGLSENEIAFIKEKFTAME